MDLEKLEPAIFWDVDIRKLDVEQHKVFIIERIMLRGTWNAFREILKTYGKKEIKDIMLQTRYLDKKTLAFCSAFFSEPQKEFRCYKLAQLNPEHWNY